MSRDENPKTIIYIDIYIYITRNNTFTTRRGDAIVTIIIGSKPAE